MKNALFLDKEYLIKFFLTFELVIESGKHLPTGVFVGFMESDAFDEQTRSNSAFVWLHVSSAVCRLGEDRYPDKYKNFDCPRNNFHEFRSRRKFFFTNTLKIA